MCIDIDIGSSAEAESLRLVAVFFVNCLLCTIFAIFCFWCLRVVQARLFPFSLVFMCVCMYVFLPVRAFDKGYLFVMMVIDMAAIK